VSLFRVTQTEVFRFPGVAKAEPRDPAVTEYVRFRVTEILTTKEMSGQEMARIVGVSPATISTIGTTGVGSRSIDGFARLLKFKDANGLRRTAYEWWQQQQPRTEARMQEPEVQAAIEGVKLLQPWVTDEQIRTILHAFTHERFDGRHRGSWQSMLLNEISEDVLRKQREAAAQQTAANERAQDRGKIRRSFREASAIKARLADDRAVAELEAPPAPPPPAAESSPVVSTSPHGTPRRRRKKSA
jgi:hypothetical protein